MPEESQLEFSRVFDVGELQDDGSSRELKASPEELTALQKRYGLDALDEVRGELKISALEAGAMKVTGKIFARLSQTCVVTLEPVDEVIGEFISIAYLPEGAEDPEEEEVDPLSDEEYEFFDGKSVDLGELVAQQIAAAINPYPRKDGAELGKVASMGDSEPVVRENSFAVLGKLKGDAGDDRKH